MNINGLSDSHLRAAFDSQMQSASYKPAGKVSILITDTCISDEVSYDEDKQVENMKFWITKTLREDKGSVLIPIESTGRCLEVIMKLEEFWNDLNSYKIYFVTKYHVIILLIDG